MRSCTARMQFVDVTALKDSAVTLNECKDFCNVNLIKERINQKNYATLERNQFVLDGTKVILPAQPEDIVAWTNEKSGEQCTFETVSVIDVDFHEPHSSTGITLCFAGRYPSDLKIAWYTLDGVFISSQRYYPDSNVYYCENLVDNFGKLKIEILGTQYPDSYVRLQYIMYGLELIFDESVIKKIQITESNDCTSATLPENTACIDIIDEKNEFDVENSNGSWKAIQPSQEVSITSIIEGKESDAGTFYITDFSFKDNIATFNMTDAIGLLDGQMFYDGTMYKKIKAGILLEEVFAAAGFEKYVIEEDVYNTELSGYLGVMSCRECVKAICFACGAEATDAKSDTLTICHPDRYVKHTVGTNKKISGSTNVSLEQYVSGVAIECSNYISGKVENEIYNGTLDKGLTRLTFDIPYDKDTITSSGGTIVKASTNYVDINMEEIGVCVIKGVGYEEKGFTYQKNVNMLPAGTKVNVQKFGKCTLYNTALIPKIAEKLLDYYSLQKVLEMRFFAENESAGDWLNVSNVNGMTSYTMLEEQTIDLASGIISTARCRGYNVVVTELYFTGTELYAGGVGLI